MSDDEPTMTRPLVTVNMACTVDGKITSASREYPRFTSPVDRDRMDRLRAEADALLVGAGTMRADNPKLHVRSKRMREYRRSLGRPDALLKVLVSASARLSPESRFLDDTDGGARILATVDRAPSERIAALAGRAEIWRLGVERVDLRALLEKLAERGVKRLLCEGGGELNWELARAGLIDELYVTVAPCLLGGRDAPTLLEGDGWKMARQCRLRLADLHRERDEIYCRYVVERDDDGPA
jgi:2,5-diamino-6-(ribosylamino)-4(3H)-pyrimidinone 5'-phosphate reductase